MARKGGTPENLKPVRKGDPSRGGGRPKQLPELKRLFTEILLQQCGSMTALEAMMQAVVDKAIRGDLHAFGEIMDRVYGTVKPLQDASQNTQFVTFNIDTNGETTRVLDVAHTIQK
jgi:Family of unknown function (DUF5681)